MTTKAADGREIALDALIEVLERGCYSHVVLGQALSKYQYLSKPERSFISRTVEGTIEYLIQLDYIINHYSKTKVNKMKPLIRNLLRMSVYQLLYMDRIPDSAVCDEAVKLAKKRHFAGLSGFVNGVLRAISRQKDAIALPDDGVRYSMPSWLMELWGKRYGEEILHEMLEAFLEPSKTAVRCNFDKADKDDVLSSLRNQGVTVQESGYAAGVLYLSHYDYLEGLEAFQQGWITVQDLSSSFVGEVAGPAPGSYVIDVCGAPGGKSLHIADQLAGTGMVEVRDLTEQKVALIRENIERTGFTNIRARVQDALVRDPGSIEKADLLIADLPCSGLGVIGRKPEIKYRMTGEKTKELAALQREILSVVWEYVKPGGRLIYSTCTVNEGENEDNVRWFLEHYPFTPVNIEGKLGKISAAEDTMRAGWVQLLPGVHPCDGFFIAAFERKI